MRVLSDGPAPNPLPSNPPPKPPVPVANPPSDGVFSSSSSDLNEKMCNKDENNTFRFLCNVKSNIKA